MLTTERILDIAEDFKSSSMSCGVLVDYFDSLGFARAIEQAAASEAIERCATFIETETHGLLWLAEQIDALRRTDTGGKTGPQGPVGPGAEGICNQVNKILKPFGVKLIVNYGRNTMPFTLSWRSK